MTVRLVDLRNLEPIPEVVVEAERWEGPKGSAVAAEVESKTPPGDKVEYTFRLIK